MMFLQPMALLAIPLIAIPIIIHWLNHRRHQPIQWGAMYFLKQAQKYNKGMARLRYWLLLALRMAAVAGVLFVISRPLRTGFLGSLTGSTQTSIILLDRSPSMEMIDPTTGLTKREVAIEKLDAMFATLGSSGKRLLVHSPEQPPLEIPPDTPLRDLLEVQSLDATSDIVNSLVAAIAYAKENVTGPVDFWVCSDGRESDWNSESSRWEEVRSSIKSLPVYRLNLLNVDSSDTFNAALTVDHVLRRESDRGAELVFDIRIVQTNGPLNARQIPATFEIEGNRTSVDLELSGRELSRSGVTIPIDSKIESGFGTVSIPSDSNMADNVYRYVFAKSTTGEAVIIAEDKQVAQLLKVTLETSTDSQVPVRAQVVTDREMATIDWQRTALLVWQSAIPNQAAAEQLERFVNGGGVVVFLPPTSSSGMASATNNSIFETRWGEWTTQGEGESQGVADWRSDSDLLRNSDTGLALPLNELRIESYRAVENKNLIPIAVLHEQKPLVARVATQRGAVYFVSSLPLPEYSNMAEDGINWYIMMHRALEYGAVNTGRLRMLQAGHDVPADIATWRQIDSGPGVGIEGERALRAGVYEKSGQVLAINRTGAEDNVATVSPEVLNEILAETNVHQINDVSKKSRPLASEIWHWFVVALVLCLMGEAWLTLPREAKGTDRSSNLGSRSPLTQASRI